jgi:hypothetical protein
MLNISKEDVQQLEIKYYGLLNKIINNYYHSQEDILKDYKLDVNKYIKSTLLAFLILRKRPVLAARENKPPVSKATVKVLEAKGAYSC